MLTINEIFHSIQGESTHAGRPCVFVRLTACDLRCSWCDTPYAFHEGRKMSRRRGRRRTSTAFDCPLVEITGGEPLLQEDVYPLMDVLLARGHTVMLETGGHRSVAHVPAGVVRIVDVKCPASGEAAKNDWANLDLLTATTKSSSSSRIDRTTSSPRTSSRATPSTCRCAAILISPVHGVLGPRTSRSGSSPTACQCGCSSSRTSTSGVADPRGV